MIKEDDGPAEAAIAFTDRYVDAAVAKLDAVFGQGYAAANPQALAAYLATCASSLGTLLAAASDFEEEADFNEALAMFEEEPDPQPEPRSKGKRR